MSCEKLTVDNTRGGDDSCQPGDLYEYRCPKWGIVTQWRVLSVHYGTLRQESLIELQSVTNSPGYSHRRYEESMWVPEPLLRGVAKFRPPETERKA